MVIDMDLGDVIRAIREKRQQTQADLAKAARCSQQTIAKIENNKVRKPQNLPNIAKALGVTTEEILQQVTTRHEPTTLPAIKKRNKNRSRSRWPFRFSFALFAALSPSDQLKIDAMLYQAIADLGGTYAVSVKDGKDRAVGRGTKSSPHRAA